MGNITMNSFAFATILALFVACASATFDAATGIFSLGAVALNGGNSLALTLGSSTAFLTSAGIVAGGLGLLALGLIKATWDKLPDPRLPAHADTPGVPWTARPFHKLWLRW